MKSYKNKSVLYNVIGYIIAVGGTITVTQWTSILPADLDFLATIIVAVFGFLLTQISENKRVLVAEQNAVEGATNADESEGI